ncbi:MAG: LTA synthase family protein [Chitinophagaceae bacterium]|nr:LTA synthase family protein [Chitinophagaceae bacterium]
MRKIFKEHPYKIVILQLLGLTGIYQVSRLLFFLFNRVHFAGVGLAEYGSFMLNGLRFDLSVIFLINLPYLFLMLLPVNMVYHRMYQKAAQIWFVISNVIFILFDLGDIGYFPYVRKRMTADVLDLIGRQSDFLNLLPSYIFRFWYVTVLMISLTLLFFVMNRKINKTFKQPVPSMKIRARLIILVLTAGLSILIIRGGFQLRPIMPVDALKVANNQNQPLVVNTPFSILHTFGSKKLIDYQLFKSDELNYYFKPVKHYQSTEPIRKMNVVLIVLESFGKSYTALGGRKSYTPFIDSLASHSLVCTRAFANAFRSADGIPACVAGIPHFADEAFAMSPYAANSITTIPNLLKPYGYHSTFFHGGSNGTMSFDLFAKHAGYDKYYGRDEYPVPEDYDGTWGIWDQPFLQFMAGELDREPQPFFSTVFTLSSHEPFALPAQYKNQQIRNLKGIYRGISYTDEALRDFFRSIQHKDWFQNTIFVITADHNFLVTTDDQNYYNKDLGLHSIPVLFYAPSLDTTYRAHTRPFQQIDILPTLMDILHYPDPFFAYGKSAMDTVSPNFVFSLNESLVYFMMNDHILTYYDTSLTGIYHFPTDSVLIVNRWMDDSVGRRYIPYYLAFRQWLNHSLLHDQQTIKAYQGLN